VLDLDDVTDDELESLGAKLVQVRRFRKAVASALLGSAPELDTANASPERQEL
jgi:hypothetical protein